jgi:hypothetical protein
MDDHSRRRSSSARRSRSRSKSKDNKNTMRAPPGRKATYHRKHDSFLVKDDESQQLIAVDLQSTDESSGVDTNSDDSSGMDYSSSSCDSTARDLNTLGENSTLLAKMRKTLGENNIITNGHVVSPSQRAPPAVSPASTAQGHYGKSIRKKFQFMRNQHQFAAAGGQDPPCDMSLASGKSLKANENLAKSGMNQRRNELAKQILRRRKDVVAVSRTGFDPPLAKQRGRPQTSYQ